MTYTDIGSAVYGYGFKVAQTQGQMYTDTDLDGATQVDTIKTRVESASCVCNQRLKLQYDERLSHFAFKFNLRRFIWACRACRS